MPKVGADCKICKKWFIPDVQTYTYARYNFCSQDCLFMYKHIKSDNCCIHKKGG